MMDKASLQAKLTLGSGALMTIALTMSAIDCFSIQKLGRLSAAANSKATEANLARTKESQ